MPAEEPPTTAAPPTNAVMGQLCLLGLPRLLPRDGAPVYLGPRDAALLTLVVLRGPLARATLASWMWPEVASARALNNLRQRLFQLRQTAGGELLTAHDSLALAAAWRHDLVPQPARWRHGDALPQLLGDVDLHAWPALSTRIDDERQRWQLAWQDAMVGHAELLEGAGRIAEGQALAAALVRANPISEHAHRRLIRLHYLRGDNAAALAAYADCRRLLQQHLGLAPGAETNALRDLVATGGVRASPAVVPSARQPSLRPARETASAPQYASETTPDIASEHPPAAAPSVFPLQPLPRPQQRALLRRPPVLAGREAAWQAMAAAWHAGQAIVLQGPSGAGKSRLAEDFARAQGPVQLLQAQRTDQALPLSSLARWLDSLQPLLPPPPTWSLPVLAHLLPALGQPCDPFPPPQRLQQAVLTWLAFWPQSGLGALLIDDWPWIDSESLQVLAAWLNQDATLPVRLLLVQSADSPDSAPAPAAGLPWWLHPAADRPLLLSLSPLPLVAVADLLADLQAAHALPAVTDIQLPLLAQRLHQASGGLPSAVLALLRAVPAQAWCIAAGQTANPTPGEGLEAARQPALAAVLAGRMTTLPASALRLLRLAALAGAQFDVALAAAVLGAHALDLSDDWARLQDAHWLDSDGLLAAPLRDAVAAGVPPAIRQVMHAQLAQALTIEGAAPEHLWRHWAAARRWPEAAAAAAETARQARTAHMASVELAAWDATAQACDAAGDAAGAWRARHSAVWPALSLEPTSLLLKRTVQLHDAASTTLQRIDALLARSRVALDASEHALALEPAEKALALASEVGDAGRVLHAGGWLWLARALAGAVQPALAELQASAQEVAVRPDLRQRLDVLGSLGYVQHMAGQYSEAMASITQAARCAEELGALGDAREQWLNLSLCASAVGDRPLALQAGDRAMALWRRQGEPTGGAVPALNLELGTLKVAQGQFSSGMPLLERALTYFRSHPGTTWRVIGEHRLANAWLRLGQPARARQALTPLPGDASAGGRAARAMVLARLAQWAAQPAEALLHEALQRYGDRLEPKDRRALLLQLAATETPAAALVRCDALLLSLGGHPGAVAAVAAAVDRDNYCANQPTLVHTLARRSDAIRRLGDTAAAFADARLAWQRSALSPPLDLDYLSFCHLVAQAALAAGDVDLLFDVLQAAVAWVDGAVPFLLPAWHHGFLHLHPVHRALLAMAAAHGLFPTLGELPPVAKG